MLPYLGLSLLLLLVAFSVVIDYVPSLNERIPPDWKIFLAAVVVVASTGLIISQYF